MKYFVEGFSLVFNVEFYKEIIGFFGFMVALLLLFLVLGGIFYFFKLIIEMIRKKVS